MNTIEPNFAPLFTIEGVPVTPDILARFTLTTAFYIYRPKELYTAPKDEETYERRLEYMFLEGRGFLQETDCITSNAANQMREWFSCLEELFFFYQYPTTARSSIAFRRERAERDLNDSSSLGGAV